MYMTNLSNPACFSPEGRLTFTAKIGVLGLIPSDFSEGVVSIAIYADYFFSILTF